MWCYCSLEIFPFALQRVPGSRADEHPAPVELQAPEGPNQEEADQAEEAAEAEAGGRREGRELGHGE